MINRVVLVGRLTKDVEVRKAGELSVANFTVACDRARKTEEGPNADFVSCVAFRQPADFLGQYGKKGSLIGVDGRIQTRSYEKDGHMVYVTEVIADSVRLLEKKESSNDSNAQQEVVAEVPEVNLDVPASEDLPF